MREFAGVDVHILLLGVIVCLAVVPRFYNLEQPVWPDEAIYAKTAQNLYYGKGLTFDGSPWEYHTPFFVFTLSFSYILFGVSEFSTRIVGPFFGILGVITIYYIGRYLYNARTGLMAAFLLAVIPTHGFYSRLAMADIVLTTLMILAIFFFYRGCGGDKKYMLVAGFLIGIVCLTKRVGPIIYLILLSYLIVKRNFHWIRDKSIWGMFLLSILVQLPWYARNIILFRDPLIHTGKYVTDFTRIPDATYVSILKAIPSMISAPIFAAFLLGIYLMLRKKARGATLLGIPILMFLLIFSLWGGTSMGIHRYLLPITPFFALIGAYGLDEFSKYVKKDIYVPFIVVFFLLTVSVNAVWFGQAIPTLTEGSELRDYSSAEAWINYNIPEDAIILTDSRILRYYLTRELVYYPGDKESLQRLLGNKDKDVYLVLEGDYTPYALSYVKEYPELVTLVARFNQTEYYLEIYRAE